MLDAVWVNKKNGVAIDFGKSFFYGTSGDSPLSPEKAGVGIGEIMDINLDSQRNWIRRNPICITRGIANCYENSRSVIESMEKELKPALDRRMRPELYGDAVNRIVLNCSFSFYDNYHCKTNYIIADESLKLRQKDFYPALREKFTEKEIEDNGYYLRNRFTYGQFRQATGTMRVGIVLEKEFSDLAPQKQRQLLSEYLLHAAGQCARRMGRRIDYDFGLMIDDFSDILTEWCGVTQIVVDRL